MKTMNSHPPGGNGTTEPAEGLDNIQAGKLLASLQPSIWGNPGSGARAIGAVWNGASDLIVGDRTVPARDVAALLKRIRNHIDLLGDEGIELPTASSVRSMQCSPDQDFFCVIDVVIDGMQVPFGFSEITITGTGACWLDDSANGFVNQLSSVSKVRKRVAARDRRMRKAFHKLMTGIGGGARGVWLRMSTVDCRDSFDVGYLPYDYAMVILDPKLEDTLEGHRVTDARDLRDLVPLYRPAQRRRAARLDEIRTAGASGLIDTVAEALIRHHGRDPYDVMQECISLSRECIHAHVDLADPGERTRGVWFRDGVLHCAIEFEGGAYCSGDLMLDQRLPDAFLTAKEGRRLDEIVDHPVFAACKPRISKITRYETSTNFQHRVKHRFLHAETAGMPVAGRG